MAHCAAATGVIPLVGHCAGANAGARFVSRSPSG